MNLFDSIRAARRRYLVSKDTVKAIAKREAAKTSKAKVTTKPAVTKTEEATADRAGGSKPA